MTRRWRIYDQIEAEKTASIICIPKYIFSYWNPFTLIYTKSTIYILFSPYYCDVALCTYFWCSDFLSLYLQLYHHRTLLFLYVGMHQSALHTIKIWLLWLRARSFLSSAWKRWLMKWWKRPRLLLHSPFKDWLMQIQLVCHCIFCKKRSIMKS